MNILITKVHEIGNMVQATPTMGALRRLHPSARIDVLCTHDAAEVIIGWNAINNIYRSANELDPKWYDILVRSWPDHPMFDEIERIVHDNNGNIYRAEKPDPSKFSETEINMDIARSMGYAGETPPAHFQIGTREMAAAHRLLGQYDLRAGSLFVTMHIGSKIGNGRKWIKKRWPPERFAELSNRLYSRGVRTVLLGGLSDRDAQFIFAQSISTDNAIVDFLGKLPLKVTGAVMANSQMAITNDSGLAHIAAALGLAQIVLVGPTGIAKNRPPAAEGKLQIISHPEICKPCQNTDRFDACKDYICMQSITVDEVYDAVLKRMGL